MPQRGLPKTGFFYHMPDKKNTWIRYKSYCIHYNCYLKHFLIRAIIKNFFHWRLGPPNQNGMKTWVDRYARLHGYNYACAMRKEKFCVILKMCNIGALVSVWKASTADLMVSMENVKTHLTSNASNETLRFGAWYI